MSLRKGLCALVILTNIIFSYTNECLFQDTCESCLSTNLKCAWCTDKDYEIRYRCLEPKLLIQYGCNPDHIYENEPKYHIIQNETLSDYDVKNEKATQIQPQRVFMKLVKTNPQRFKLSYRPAQNNLLDLYVLMDLTWTMRDDKETLVKLGEELSERLRSLTRNYRLGFGSFADKPIFPMIMPHLEKNPCALEHVECEPTYGFKHLLPLTHDVSKFINSVNKSQITGNLDNLEGGMDALLQVLVCPELIGWKKDARKIIILATDGLMHFAGDGLLAGIVKRNERECHLSTKGDYTASLEYDYPSLEEIYRELIKRKVNVIFAVTADVEKMYRQLSNLIQDVSNTEILSTDSSNILELISKSYANLTQRVQFTDNSPLNIDVVYETNCGGQFATIKKQNFCYNVELGKQVDFFITITSNAYPDNGIYVSIFLFCSNSLQYLPLFLKSHKLLIEESSLNEVLEIEIEIQKPCPCNEKKLVNDENGRFQCADNGYLHCGMCQCDEGWTGMFCTCPIDMINVTSHEVIENLCRPQLKTSELGPVCSNAGECDCGTCNCFPGHSGKYCECLDCDKSCDMERSDCICGQCVCRYGWSGNECNCEESTEKCLGPTGEVCSRRGNCNCGNCICEETYRGRYCEIGSELDNKLCTYYEPCVTCLIEENLGIMKCGNKSEVCSSTRPFTYKFDNNNLDAEIICLVRHVNRDGIKCDHYFQYETFGPMENSLVIHVNNCEPINYVALISFISLATLILGLLVVLVIWYCLKMKDAREYAKFAEDQKYSKRIDNPIYRDPITRYTIPDKLIEQNKSPFS